MVSVDSLIKVSVTISSSGPTGQSTSDLLLLTNNTVIDISTRYRIYTSLAQVAVDFGSNSVEYSAASLWFGQTPQPARLLIGRWAQAAASGQLIGGALTVAQQAMNNFTAVNNGGFSVAIDGGAVIHLTGINLSAAANLNAVAALVTAALNGAATVVWNSTYGRFQITSATNGANSSISFLTAPNAGTTDISSLLGATQAFSGSFQSNGIAAETALTAATSVDAQFGSAFYGLCMPTITQAADHVAVAQYVESSARKHFYFCTTSDGGSIIPTSVTDLPYLLKNATLTKTAVQYSTTNPYAVMSLAARILTVDYTASNTSITLMWKTEPGVAPETLGDSQYASLKAKNCNVFVQLDNGTSIIMNGTTPTTNLFIDTVIGADVWAISLKAAVFNTLYSSTTKTPQTDPGMQQLVAAVEGVNATFLGNGYLGAGYWNGIQFGSIDLTQTANGWYMEKGSYTYAGPVATQLAANRQARMAVPIQVAGLLAGAIHSAAVAVTINP